MESKGAPVTRSSYVPSTSPLPPAPPPRRPANRFLYSARMCTRARTRTAAVYAGRGILVFAARVEIWKFQKRPSAFLIAAVIFQMPLARNCQFITWSRPGDRERGQKKGIEFRIERGIALDDILEFVLVISRLRRKNSRVDQEAASSVTFLHLSV